MRRSLFSYTVFTSLFILALVAAVSLFGYFTIKEKQLSTYQYHHRFMLRMQADNLNRFMEDKIQAARRFAHAHAGAAADSRKKQLSAAFPDAHRVYILNLKQPPSDLPPELVTTIGQSLGPHTFGLKDSELFYHARRLGDERYLLIGWPGQMLRQRLHKQPPLFFQVLYRDLVVAGETAGPHDVTAIEQNLNMGLWKIKLSAPQKSLDFHLEYQEVLLAFAGLGPVLLLLLFLQYRLSRSNIGRDLGTLRQIIRDMKEGQMESNYGYRMREFRGAIGTFQRLGREISEHHGYASPMHADSLTKLPNREALESAVQSLLRGKRDNDTTFAVLMIELDRYQQLQSHGYADRDKVLCKMANDIRHALRKTDFVARYCEKTFCAVFKDANMEDARKLESRMRQFIGGSVTMTDGREFFIEWTGGITTGLVHDDPASVLQRAASIVQLARQEGKHNITHTTPEPMLD